MVRLVRSGKSMRAVASQFHVDVSSVSVWVQRAAGRRLDRVDFADHKPGRAWNRTAFAMEQRIATLRGELRESVLGEHGARAIRAVLVTESPGAVPSVASINRVLSRLGLQDMARRTRRPAPPKGWYLPTVVAGQAELDCFDFIVELRFADGPLVDILTAKSLHGSLTDAWVTQRTTTSTLPLLLERWQRDGRPAYAQFDNDNVFQGPKQHAHAVGRISRLCLQLGVIPVFVPPLEHGMQNTIESFNGLWQAKVWGRHYLTSVDDLQAHSDRYIAAHRARTQALAEAAPRRRTMPAHFEFNPQAPLHGQMIFIRRTDETGHAQLLGQRFAVSPHWLHRLVRCEVNFDHNQIRCFALRRHTPAEQPLLKTIPYQRSTKPLPEQP
jgi:hypothetical protein